MLVKSLFLLKDIYPASVQARCTQIFSIWVHEEKISFHHAFSCLHCRKFSLHSLNLKLLLIYETIEEKAVTAQCFINYTERHVISRFNYEKAHCIIAEVNGSMPVLWTGSPNGYFLCNNPSDENFLRATNVLKDGTDESSIWLLISQWCQTTLPLSPAVYRWSKKVSISFDTYKKLSLYKMFDH